MVELHQVAIKIRKIQSLWQSIQLKMELLKRYLSGVDSKIGSGAAKVTRITFLYLLWLVAGSTAGKKFTVTTNSE